jgi:hypothetical protein
MSAYEEVSLAESAVGFEAVTVSQVLMPLSKACLMIGNAFASGMVHSICEEVPYCMHPNTIFETLSPDFPSLFGWSAALHMDLMQEGHQ